MIIKPTTWHFNIFGSLFFRQTEGPALLEPLVAAGREQHFGLRRPELFIHFRLFRKIFTLDYPFSGKYLLFIWHRQPLYWCRDGTLSSENPNVSTCSRMWEQCWGVLAAAHAVLDAADCGHAASLPDVHSQGGPGDQWQYITLLQQPEAVLCLSLIFACALYCWTERRTSPLLL